MSLLSTYQEREARLLASHDVIHSFDRNWPAYLALPLINTITKPKVLEIGCGNGYALTTILEEDDNIQGPDLTGTSLSSLPQHSNLIRRGINVYTNIIAEDLPAEWSGTMDIVMACVVMQWTDLTQSVPKVLQTLKRGGYFLGYDDATTIKKILQYGKMHSKIKSHEGKPSSIAEYHAFVIQKL